MKRVSDPQVIYDAFFEFSKAMTAQPVVVGFGIFKTGLDTALPEIQKKHPEVVKIDIQPEDGGITFQVFER